MKKVLALMATVLCACESTNDDPTPYRNFYGKWFYVEAVHKEYTVSNGDTTYYRLDTVRYNDGSDHIDFLTNGMAYRVSGSMSDSLLFEEITPVFFKLDSVLCEVNSIADSAFRYNTLEFTYNETPLVLVSQSFYTLRK